MAITGTKNMLELAKEHNARFTFFSSSEIYGDPDPRYVPTPEIYRGNVSCQGPRSCYDESKRIGETLCYITIICFIRQISLAIQYIWSGVLKQIISLPNFASQIIKGKPKYIWIRQSS